MASYLRCLLLSAGLFTACIETPSNPDVMDVPNSGCGTDGTPRVLIFGADPANPFVYQPLVNGSEVQLVAGNQGGQHVWVQLHMEQMCPQMPRPVVRLVRDSDGALVGNNPGSVLRWDPVPGQPGRYRSPALAAQIYDEAFCGLLHGGALRIEASVNDQLGHSASSSVTVVLNGWSSGDSDPELLAGRDACCANVCNRLCYPSGPPDAGAGDGGAACDRDAASTDVLTPRGDVEPQDGEAGSTDAGTRDP